jgi:hypothetical protein
VQIALEWIQGHPHPMNSKLLKQMDSLSLTTYPSQMKMHCLDVMRISG